MADNKLSTNQNLQFAYLVYLTFLIQVMVNLYPLYTQPPLSWISTKDDQGGFLFLMGFFIAAAIFGLLRPYLPTDKNGWLRFTLVPLAVTALEYIVQPFPILQYFFVSGAMLFIALMITFAVTAVLERKVIFAKWPSSASTEKTRKQIASLLYGSIVMFFLFIMILKTLIINLSPWTFQSYMRAGLYCFAIAANVKLFLPALISRINADKARNI